jgi:CheY-like chemotaxis protein
MSTKVALKFQTVRADNKGMPALARKNVLVVDDEPIIRQTLKMILRFDGHHAEAAANFDQALAAMDSQKFDLVFLDYLMPGGTGDKVARAMKSKAPNQPIVLVTGYVPRPHLPDVERIIQKPFSVEDIRDALTEFA